MPHTWHAVDLRTGRRGPELRTQTRGTVSRIIGEATDAQLAVLCWDVAAGAAVPEWREWTQPGRMMAVLVDDDDRPLWGGVILRRIPNETVWVAITAATLEHYLGRRYAGSMTFTGAEQTAIASDLVQSTITAAGVPFVVETTATGVFRDRTYLDDDDKSVGSLLTDLMNLQAGIEFTVDLEWTDTTNTVLRRIVRIGPRIGKSLPQPTRFEMPGPVQSFTAVEDYTGENGANDVLAVSSGEGDARPKSTRQVDQVALDGGWVRYERRFTPSTSITELSTLNSYAAAELARVREGLLELSLVANLDTSPRLNLDWWLGDDITAVLTCPAFPPRFGPNREALPGYERTVRVVGWSIDLDARTLTPVVREYAGAPEVGGTLTRPVVEPAPVDTSDIVYGTVFGGV